MQNDFLQEFAGENDFIGVSRVSAKTSENVNFAWSQIVREILLKVYQSQGGFKERDEDITGAELKNSMMGYQDPGKCFYC